MIKDIKGPPFRERLNRLRLFILEEKNDRRRNMTEFCDGKSGVTGEQLFTLLSALQRKRVIIKENYQVTSSK